MTAPSDRAAHRRSATRRLFVAIDVPDADRLIPALEILRGRGLRVPPVERLHLTLLFMAAVPPELVDDVGRAVEDVGRRHAPFEMALTGRAGRFGSAVAWAELAPAPALEALAADLRAQVAAVGVPLDERPFHAHVTLARSGRERVHPRLLAELDLPPLSWPVEAMRLVDSALGGGPSTWTTLSDVRLGAGDSDGEETGASHP